VIETEQRVSIAAGIDDVWSHVRDIRRWAALMPGYRDCEILGEDDSRWTLKVGVGGLVRTVKVLVHVDEWSGPTGVRFTYKLEGDPVQGGGTYIAAPAASGGTDVTLQVRVEGSGSMAPMWEAMGKPLLPRLAQSFAEQLKADIEAAAPSPDAGAVDVRGDSEAGQQPAPAAPAAARKAEAPGAAPARLLAWIRRLWRAIARTSAA
jgi:carbon monoxide dehydrogenase subunit G